MTAQRASLGVLWAVFVILWGGGVVAYSLWGAPPAGTEWTAPGFLTLAALLVVVAAGLEAPRWLLVGAVGLGVEVLGVATGFPFGSYQYRGGLGPAILGVPWALAAAWLVVIAYAHAVTARWALSVPARVAVGAAWATAVDLVLDPLAAGPLQYWHWPGGGAYHGVPFTNFLGWFGVSAILLVLAPRGESPRSVTPLAVGRAVVVFFALLAAVFGFWGPMAVGWALLALDLGARRLPSSLPPGIRSAV